MSEPSSPRRRLKKKNTNKPVTDEKSIEEIQKLQMELQNKFVLDESSYPKHTKEVKKWKNRAKNQNLLSVTTEAVERVLQEILQEKVSAHRNLDRIL